MYSEIMSRRRCVQFINEYATLVKASDGHFEKSKLFNPEISIEINRSDFNHVAHGLYTQEEFIQKHDFKKDSPDFSVNMFVESDGKRAIIKRLD
jgi:hypothetical protein